MSPVRSAPPPRVRAYCAEIAVLNHRWRVIDDPLQWILQVREGQETSKSTGWRDRAYCAQRSSLIRCIGEYCDDVLPDAFAILQELPPRHPDHDTTKNPAAICGGYRAENRTCKSDSKTHSARRKSYDNT